VSEICWCGAAIICAARLLSRCISSFSFAIFSLSRVVFAVLPTILAYYQTAVVGGPMAFVVPVKAPENLVDAMRRKFVTEIAMALR
jgi:hypothetical protein